MHPSVGATFGPPGTGKSTDAVKLGAANFAFFSPPGGLRVDLSVLAIDLEHRFSFPSVFEVTYLEQALDSLPWVVQQGFAGAVLDDVSILFKNSMNRVRPGYALYKPEPAPYLPDGSLKPEHMVDTAGKGWRLVGYDRQMWNYHDSLVDRLCGARHLGIHIHVTGRTQEPFLDNEKKRYRGGLDVDWGKRCNELPFVCDLLQMTMPWPETRGEWDVRTKCIENDPDYALKDRHNIIPSMAGPLNTAEVYREYARATGSKLHQIARPRGLEWMEDFVERFAQRIVDQGLPEADVINLARDHLRKSGTVIWPHAMWAIADGTHRARLRLHRKSGWDRIGGGSTASF